MAETWATDGPVSAPIPPTGRVRVDYDGFCFTDFGIAHNVSEGDLDEMLTATFAPIDYIPGTARGGAILIDGINGIMFADGYGGHYFVGTVLDYGISVVGDAAEGRQRRTFYVRKVIDDAFSIDVEFSRYDEYKEFADWLLGYANNALAANSQTGAMRVAIPSQGFDKYGVLKTGITYGTNPQMIVFTMTLAFEGARDPASYNTAVASQFIPATGDVSNNAQYFYPGGTQLSGSDAPDNFYDVPLAGRTAVPTGSPLQLGSDPQNFFNNLTKPKPKKPKATD